MNRLNGYCLSLVAMSFVSWIAGCSGESHLATEPVQGLVTLDGQPVPEATVMFVPVTEGQGLPATGQTDAQGVYRLTAANAQDATAKAGAGTRPGEYFVGVIKSVSETPMSEEEAFEKGVKYVAPPPGQTPKVNHVVPQKFNDPKNSGIKVTVKEGENDIPISLASS